MASTSSSSSSSIHHHQSINPNLLNLLVTSINHHITSLISTPESRKLLKSKCTSILNVIHTHSSFDFAEQSVISNFYWGIQNADDAIESKRVEYVPTAEKMLQTPVSLNEDGVTAGISNACLICCSYYYLCVLSKVRGDDVRVVVNFLQAVVVAPRLVRDELAPEVYEVMVKALGCENGGGGGFEGAREGAMRCKVWLMYHEVISYGQPPLVKHGSDEIRNTKACSISSSNLYKHHQNFVKVHPIDLQQNTNIAIAEPSVSNKASETSSIKRLQDLLMEDQSDSQSLYSGTSDFSDDDFQEYAYEFDRSLRALYIAADQPPETTIATSKSSEFWNCLEDDDEEEKSTWENFQISQMRDEVLFSGENSYRVEQAEIVQKVISKLCFSDKLGQPASHDLDNANDDDQSATAEITAVYEMLANKKGLKYSLLKDVILDQLLMALSTSKEQGVTRTSVTILLSIISSNRSVIDELRKKGLNLHDLANALKQDVYEAAVLIYLIDPSPNEIKTLELMPTLVKIICSSSGFNDLKSPFVTPHSASLMIIQVLVTAFDYSTNITHLALITSPEVISCLVNVTRNGNLEEVISLAAILVKCMRFDGQCRYHISHITSVYPFMSLILSNHKDAVLAGLEFYHELLKMPRSASVSLLQQLKDEGGINIMCVLLLAIQQTQQEYKLLAASLLLQLDVLEESVDKTLNREVAIQTLLESLKCEEKSESQQLAAFILSNIGGTYSWSGEPYTIAWLVKKAGLNSMLHKNIVKNIDWSDDTIQENVTEVWSGKVARHIIKLGNPVFHALKKGLKSKNERISRDCLTTIAWFGCEIIKGPDDLRCVACDILLSAIEQYVHPGIELEERLLACLCMYNYTFGRGMQKLTQLSEGVRESLRRLSSITWMAEELLKVADYYMPNKWRISCGHTQLLEANYNGSGVGNMDRVRLSQRGPTG